MKAISYKYRSLSLNELSSHDTESPTALELAQIAEHNIHVYSPSEQLLAMQSALSPRRTHKAPAPVRSQSDNMLSMSSQPSSPTHSPSPAAHDDKTEQVESATTEAEAAPVYPMRTILLLCLLNLNESFMMNVIWPFIPFMIDSFHVASATAVGVYVGVCACAFFAGQFFSAFFWGLASDRWGRRPTLIIGAACSCLAMLLFGLSTGFREMLGYTVCVAARFCAGALNGNVGIVKTYLSELLPPTQQGRGFSSVGLAWGVGGIAGALIGGTTCRLHELYGLVVPMFRSPFFSSYPYLLPCLISCLLSIGCSLSCYLYLPETKAFLRMKQSMADGVPEGDDSPSRRATNSNTSNEQEEAPQDVTQLLSASENGTSTQQSNNSTSSAAQGNAPTRFYPISASLWYVLTNSYIMRTIVIYGLVALIFVLYDELLPLFIEAPMLQQGLQLQSTQTGLLLGVSGAGMVLFQLFLFPWLHRRYGEVALLRTALLLLVPYFCIFPTASMVESYGNDVLFWFVLITFCLGRAVLGSCCFTPVFMLVSNSADAAHTGAVNGVGQSLASLCRTIGPFLGGCIWSSSLQLRKEYAQYHVFFVYSFMAAITAITYTVVKQLPPKPSSHSSSEQAAKAKNKSLALLEI